MAGSPGDLPYIERLVRCACEAEGEGKEPKEWCEHCVRHVDQERDRVTGDGLEEETGDHQVSQMEEDIPRQLKRNAELAGAVDALVERHAGPDPWKHRAVGMTCSSCMWFVRKAVDQLVVRQLGRCRRHAPTMSGYPAVFEEDWCGDHSSWTR